MTSAPRTRRLVVTSRVQAEDEGARRFRLVAFVGIGLSAAAWLCLLSRHRALPVVASTAPTARAPSPSDAPLAAVGPRRPASPPVVPCLDDALPGARDVAAWNARSQREPQPDGGPMPVLRAPADATALPSAQLAYVRGGALRVRSIPGGRDRSIVGPERAPRDARWSRAGTRLAFLARDPGADEGAPQHVYVVTGDGPPVRVSARAASGPPSFSPDGTQIAFAGDGEGAYVVGLDGSGERRFETHGRVEVGPVFAPSSGSVTFADQGYFDVAGTLARGDLSSGKTRRIAAPGLGRAFSLAFVDGDLLVSGEWRLDPRAENHLFRLSSSAPNVARDVGGLVSTYDGGYTTVIPAPQGKRYVRASRIFAKVFGRDGENDTVAPGNWQRQDLFVVDGPKPPSHSFTKANAAFPQPRLETGEAAFGPDARHLAFDVALLDFEGSTHDSRRLAEGIVAVDLDQPEMPPIFLACGTNPQWAPMPDRDTGAVVTP